MSFKNFVFRPVNAAPCCVKDVVLSHSIVDGVDIVTPVEVDASTLVANLPSPDDYKLSNLVKAGVDVHVVNPVIYSDMDADVAHVVDDVLTPDNVNEVSND